MGNQKDSFPARYLIFRLEEGAGPKSKPVFLTGKSTWSSNRALARRGTLSAMKALIAKLKDTFPDLILEQCRE